MGTEQKSKGKGCLCIFLWVLLIFNILMCLIGILALNENGTDSTDSDIPIIAFFGLCAVICAVALIIIKSNSAVSTQNIDALKAQVDKESNPLKKKILNDHIGFLLQNYTERKLKPLIDEYEKKASKSTSP